MELKQAIEKRISVRSYTNEQVKEEDLREIVRRAGLSPSINNIQPWKFIAISNRTLIKKMAETVSKKLSELPLKTDTEGQKQHLARIEWYSTFFDTVPTVIAIIMQFPESDLEKSFDLTPEELTRLNNYSDFQSAGAVIQSILLSAIDLGYGACWLNGPMIAKKELEDILKINTPMQLVSFVTVGKPFGYPQRLNKKSLDEIFTIIK
jgi:nitroreductase